MFYLAAESSHFIRFNHAAVRQATQVRQGYVTLSVVRGSRRVKGNLSLTGLLEADAAALLSERATLLAQLSEVGDDPYLLLPAEVHSSERHEQGALPEPPTLVAAVVQAAAGLDFVGFYSGGAVVRAFADCRGQRNWHHVQGFHFDWCLYHAADKAIKSAKPAQVSLVDAGLATLGTGLYVSKLWYLNYSDRPACRMTGMTRFSCFWVEGGKLVAPVNVMRFDDSFLRMFGEGLVALTRHTELIPDSSTYRERQLNSITTPGALVSDWCLTL